MQVSQGDSSRHYNAWETVLLSGVCVRVVRKMVKSLGGEVRGETEKGTVLPSSAKQTAVDIPVTSSHFNSAVKLKEAY